MASSAVLLVKYGDCFAVKEFRRGMVHSNLVEFVKSRWGCLYDDKLVFRYYVPTIGEFKLDDDVDLEGMFLVVDQFAIHRLEVVVKNEVQLPPIGAMSMICSTSTAAVPLNCLHPHIVEDSTDVVDPIGDEQIVPSINKLLLCSNWADLITDVGQIFRGGRLEFRKSLAKYAFQLGFQFRYTKNDKRRVTAVCKFKEEKDCEWRIHASLEIGSDFFIVRTYNKFHICGAAFSAAKRLRMASKIIADEIVEDLKAKPLMCPNDVIVKGKIDYGIDIDYHVARRAVEATKIDVFGDEALSYSHLRLYFREAERCNPDSVFDLEVEDTDNSFKRCFFSFGASLSGFRFCRQMLFLDGTFLTGKYKGVLLSATAKDARNGLYPIAFALVRDENKENWDYFMKHLKIALNTDNALTFISDRHRGILDGVKNVFPHCHHSFCLHHLENNLRDKLKGLNPNHRDALVNIFKACAYAPTREIFHQNLDKLKASHYKQVKNFLTDLPYENWAAAYFEGLRYGEVASSAAESWNGAIKKHCHLPITELVDAIRRWITKKVSQRVAESNRFTTMLCPTMEQKLKDFVESGRTWNCRRSSATVLEVISDPPAIVDLFSRSCTCRKWQQNGFPCCHAAVALYHTPENERYNYIDPLFYVSAFRTTYSFSISPFLVDFGQVEQPIVGPPASQKRRGRPKKKRIPSRGENIRKKIKCGRCGEFGHHNKKSCTKDI